MDLSVVIPLYNEEENVQSLLGRLYQALQEYAYEIILVDDGSTDHTVAKARAYATECVHIVGLPRNYGQSFALKTGIDLAGGRYIVTMDGDLQNDPVDIPRLLHKIDSGLYDMVAGYRAQRNDPWHRKLPSQIANRLIRFTTGVHLRDYGCTLKIFTSKLAKSLDLHGELHRFIPVLAHLQGGRITQIPVRHFSRVYGQSKYGLNRTLKVVSDLIMVLFFQKYWARAMHLFGSTGIILFTVGATVLGYLLKEKLTGSEISGRPLVSLGIFLVLSGLQFISFGLIAEILYRIHSRCNAGDKQGVIQQKTAPKENAEAAPMPY